ncbi:MAG: hypothetical protein LBN21_07015 [Treponema sp.]|jgi:hypothetical protein|nr:hypothetical protein [Treponema sp.]
MSEIQTSETHEIKDTAILDSLIKIVFKAEENGFTSDFSGGQIENIARKRAVDFILSGNNPPLEKMKTYCMEETLEKNGTSRIGFGV